MDAKKILLLVLIVIAVLTAMFIGVGLHRDRTDTPYQQDSAFAGFDRVFGRRFRKPFDTLRIANGVCGWNGQMFQFGAGECEIAIAEGKSRSSGFELVAIAGVVHACFGFERDQLTKCIDDADKRGKVEKGKRFMVSKDSAILRLYCQPVGGGPCTVRLSRAE